MAVIPVRTPSRAYDVHVRWKGLEAMLRQALPPGDGRLAVLVSDAGVDPLYGDRAEKALAEAGWRTGRLVHPPGEDHKNLGTVNDIYEGLFRLGADRTTRIVGLGGGIPGDVAGFAAGTFLRGVPYYAAPTSLLAQVDAAVGGKVGVNHPSAGKNMIGLFRQPWAVLVDPSLPLTQSPRDFSAGLAEAVKYGVLQDRPFFEEMEKRREGILARSREDLLFLVERSVRNKVDVVARDEDERGDRALLNLGHTFAHAFEAVLPAGALLHGEAVAVGMVLAGRLARRVTGFPEADLRRLEDLLRALGLPADWPGGAAPEQVYEALLRDKKFRGGAPRLVLPRALGSASVRQDCPLALLRDFLVQCGRR